MHLLVVYPCGKNCSTKAITKQGNDLRGIGQTSGRVPRQGPHGGVPLDAQLLVPSLCPDADGSVELSQGQMVPVVGRVQGLTLRATQPWKWKASPEQRFCSSPTSSEHHSLAIHGGDHHPVNPRSSCSKAPWSSPCAWRQTATRYGMAMPQRKQSERESNVWSAALRKGCPRTFCSGDQSPKSLEVALASCCVSDPQMVGCLHMCTSRCLI